MKNHGFTLVEILIVVLTLSILAMIALPRFTQASTDANESSLKSDLQTIRSQLELYKAQHGEQYPQAIVGNSSSLVIAQLTSATDANGNTQPQSGVKHLTPGGASNTSSSATNNVIGGAASSALNAGTSSTYPLGPYLMQFPANPFVSGSAASAIEFGTQDPAPGDGTTGWYINTQTGKFSCNDSAAANPNHVLY